MAKKRRGRSAAFMRSINPYLRRKKSYSRGVKMRRKKRSSRRGSSILGVTATKAVAALLVGYGRQKASNMLMPYTSKLPFGNVSDEAGMFLAEALAKKYLFKKAGVLREVLSLGQVYELIRVGETAANGQLI